MIEQIRTSEPHPCDHKQYLLSVDSAGGLTDGQAMEGIAIFGGTGSGKTTASGFQLSLAMLRSRSGGLFLTIKVDETDRRRKLCELAGGRMTTRSTTSSSVSGPKIVPSLLSGTMICVQFEQLTGQRNPREVTLRTPGS